jgi:hypothetical protein
MQLSQLKKEDTVTTTYVRICDVRKWGEGWEDCQGGKGENRPTYCV